MKQFLAVLALSIAVALTLPVAAQQPAPEIAFDSVPNFFKLPPDLHLGEASGVAVNSKGHVFVFTRANTTGPAYGATAAMLLEFAPDGKFLREVGHNLYAWSFAHAVRIDRDDNIWAIDKGSDMVVKFNPEGRVAMVFGRKKEASDEAGAWTKVFPPRPPVEGQFRQPTDVTWNGQGDIFISDGYVNSRVAKFTRGDWVKSFGQPGAKPGELNTPHSIASDASGNIYVADRGNRRVQVFDGDGTFRREFRIDVPVPADARPAIGPLPAPTPGPLPAASTTPNAPPPNAAMQPGAPWAICITPGPNAVLFAADAFPGRVYKLSLEGEVLGVLGKAGKQPKQFGWIHGIACPSEHEIYVAELLNWRVQKLVLHAPPQKVSQAR